jgi:hypothetical protein
MLGEVNHRFILTHAFCQSVGVVKGPFLRDIGKL